MFGRKHLILLFAFASLASGCRDVYLSDDIDLDFNWMPIPGRGDSLHLPYVVGTDVTISANDNREDGDELTWVVESTDESVLVVHSQFDGRARCEAVGVGTTTIRVMDQGEELYRRQIEVRAPTRAELYFHGPLILGHDIEDALTQPHVKILEGGTATFMIRYYDGNERLYGNGVLSAESDGAVIAEPEQTFVFENREWLRLTPQQTGSFDVQLYAGGNLVGSGTVQGVTADEVDTVELIGESENGAQDQDILSVLAQAYDSDGNPIYGIEYSWDVEGLPDEGYGDLYKYEYSQDETVGVTASFDSHQAETTIHAADGWVWSTNNIGCSVVATEPSGESMVASLGILAVLLIFGLKRRFGNKRRDA